MKVAKWGNSLAIRLPNAVTEALALAEGDEIEVIVSEARVFALTRKPTPASLIARIKKMRDRLPADFKFDRLDANAR